LADEEDEGEEEKDDGNKMIECEYDD